MTASRLRQEFLNFFEKKGHKIIPSSSLLPTDSSVLFTTAGMQQFKPYYLGEKSPFGSNVASCQKCFRTSDIEEVGETPRHLTFFEMLGNFSFGGYFKKEAIELAYELLNSKFKIPNSKLIVTVFGGDAEVPRDEESVKIWEKLGFSKKKDNLRFAGREDNFWGPTGEEGPCGPTTEIYFVPSGNLEQGIEIWNLVFNEYYQDKNKKLSPLKQKGIDTGMGLERLAMVVQGKSNVFETDLFLPIIQELNSKFKIQNSKLRERSERIIADHIKGSVFLISEEILPSNIERGYVLRRILRRAIKYGKLLNCPKNFLLPLAQKVIEIYQDVYPELKSKETDILTVIQNEEEKFAKTLEQGLKEFEKMFKEGKFEITSASGIAAFDLYQSYGFPLEMTQEMVKEKGGILKVEEFEKAFNQHQEISRAGVEKKFGGIGIEKVKSQESKVKSIRLHTATHLLQAALRQILGNHVKQMGSDITPQRLRFDFSHPAKMTEEEIKKVENLVNQKIQENLEVKKEEMLYEKAIKSGALAFFKEKYPARITVYSINNFSKEICAGPHVQRTLELGYFKIIKEESSGAGIRRIRAILE